MQNSLFWKLSLFIIICSLSFSSCEKESLKGEEVEPIYAGSKTLLDILQDPESFQQLKAALPSVEVSEITEDGASSRNANFITPLINNDGLILFDEEGNFSFFGINEFDEGDFWRENPDGTISVHINSDDAFAFYSGEEGSFEGEQAKLIMNYTGTYTEIEIVLPPPLPPVVIRIIDTTTDPQNAYQFKGQGAVNSSEDDTERNLKAQFVRTPSGQRNGFIKLQ